MAAIAALAPGLSEAELRAAAWARRNAALFHDTLEQQLTASVAGITKPSCRSCAAGGPHETTSEEFSPAEVLTIAQAAELAGMMRRSSRDAQQDDDPDRERMNRNCEPGPLR